MTKSRAKASSKAPAPASTSRPIKVIAINRRARFDYELGDKTEAGIALVGTEVKSLRDGKLNLGDSYCQIDRHGEVYLRDAHISPYGQGTHGNHEPLRPRKLLLNRREIRRMAQRVREKGLTLIPTRMYFKNGRAKVEIALAKGKRQHDKREQIRERDVLRDSQRQLT